MPKKPGRTVQVCPYRSSTCETDRRGELIASTRDQTEGQLEAIVHAAGRVQSVELADGSCPHDVSGLDELVSDARFNLDDEGERVAVIDQCTGTWSVKETLPA
ncbi:hypothetical protein [Deinococcus enclensis]|uniref:Uncharacterized protein n=1 Tax=Deinococcus enclensis TaxID=1049582 RepID=A0ABT9MFL8_9DEIO|nr:hypothetical protein [Deinococcus enclensis]MDP9765251.1 hypothetical protein [Deinococcus enclensis]